MFKDTKDGQTHSQNDNCGDINHNEWCGGCGKLLQRYVDNYKTINVWDGRSYHCTCSKWPLGHVLSIG